MTNTIYYMNIPCTLVAKLSEEESVIEFITDTDEYWESAPVEGFQPYKVVEPIYNKIIVNNQYLSDEIIDLNKEFQKFEADKLKLKNEKNIFERNQKKEYDQIIKKAEQKLQKIEEEIKKRKPYIDKVDFGDYEYFIYKSFNVNFDSKKTLKHVKQFSDYKFGTIKIEYEQTVNDLNYPINRKLIRFDDSSATYNYREIIPFDSIKDGMLKLEEIAIEFIEEKIKKNNLIYDYELKNLKSLNMESVDKKLDEYNKKHEENEKKQLENQRRELEEKLKNLQDKQ